MSKNTRNRILLTALAALLLVTLTIGGTVAWLTATSGSVTNTFTTSKVEVNLTEEAKDFQMVPGATITKDPKVTLLDGSEDAWVFVKVTKENNLDTYIENYTPNTDNWYSCGDNVWVYKEPLSAGKSAQFLTSVKVKDTVTTVDMAAAAEEGNEPKLIFTPYAIQSANLKVGDVDITTGNIKDYAAQVWALVGRDLPPATTLPTSDTAE